MKLGELVKLGIVDFDLKNTLGEYLYVKDNKAYLNAEVISVSQGRYTSVITINHVAVAAVCQLIITLVQDIEVPITPGDDEDVIFEKAREMHTKWVEEIIPEESRKFISDEFDDLIIDSYIEEQS